MAKSYYKNSETKLIVKLRDTQKELPLFLGDLFHALSDYTTARTRLGYAYDLKIFFTYLSREVCHKKILFFKTDDLANLSSVDIEGFMDYLTYYFKAVEDEDGISEVPIQNEALGKSRKLAAVRTMFKYFYGRGLLPSNPAELVGFPKLREKSIITLEVNEISMLLDTVESGEKLTDRQKCYHMRTKIRDVALMTLLLGTGMRVSECVGLDLHDVNFETGGLKVTRKGGDEMILYFGIEVSIALSDYLKEREGLDAIEGHETALFLSLQNRRISERAVQNLVKKYATLVTTLKNISPHKLRSTFGTQLYQETQDIYLVANVLGHADVNTTRKHYAKMDDDRRRKAANAVKLRIEN